VVWCNERERGREGEFGGGLCNIDFQPCWSFNNASLSAASKGFKLSLKGLESALLGVSGASTFIMRNCGMEEKIKGLEMIEKLSFVKSLR
jgi:hypothetical protein